jgi:hypothetical protein
MGPSFPALLATSLLVSRLGAKTNAQAALFPSVTHPLPGYHLAVHILGEYTSCSLFPVHETVRAFEFNQEYEVILRFMFPDHYAHQFHPGDTLEFYEGSKKVAQGILLSL